MESENSIRYAFIRGFFDADGWFHINSTKNDYRIGFGQSEFHIIKNIREILQEEFKTSDILGPYQSKTKNKPYYQLHLYGIEQLLKFNKLIKPGHPEK